MKQLVELQAEKQKFEELGLEMVVVTYDSEEAQQKFAGRHKFEFPLVSDIETTTVRALGIFNDQIEADSGAYGVPFPGFFVLDKNGTIRSRSFLEGYETRISAQSLLAMADQALTER